MMFETFAGQVWRSIFRNHHVVSLIFSFSAVCTASTVTAIVCPKGIVVASDSGETIEINGNTSAGREASATKFVVVQKHLVVASIGIGDFSGKLRGRQYDYHFVEWMSKLQEGLISNTSPKTLTEKITTEAVSTLSGFDGILRAGAMKHEDIREEFALFIEYIILGYSMTEPQIYDIRFYIDWSNKKVLSPQTLLVYPNEHTVAGSYNFLSFGVKEALDDIRNPSSYAHRQLLTNQAYRNMIARRDINLEEIAEVARAEVLIEENINPTHVFGAIVSTTISSTGIVGTIERASSHERALSPTTKAKTKQSPKVN